MKVERDIAVAMRDGVRLFGDVYLPDDGGTHPVVLSVTPYGRNRTANRIIAFFMRLGGVRFGKVNCSRWTGFESPDPQFWTDSGYNVIQFDVRGMHKSEGRAGVLTSVDAEDYADLIDWCSRQPWSTGAVGLCGVSYLAMSQWRVAALAPPSLKAFIPWEGATDLLREFGYQDGVRESAFIAIWWKMRMQRGRNRRYPMSEDFLKERDAHPLEDDWWASKRPALERIEIPALVCAGWSDQGLHTRGSLLGFERIRSARKWLYTHGGRKWETFYSEHARTLQRSFFDHFLKDEPNGWNEAPRVHLAVRRSLTQVAARAEHEWPIARTAYVPMYLDASTGTMRTAIIADPARVEYAAARGRPDRASFRYRFDRDTELTGGMTLKLWVSTDAGSDLDLFAKVRKFDPSLREVFFFGYNGFDRDGVAKGWLRASHREVDPLKSRPGMPWHTHRTEQPVAPNQVICVEIEILASSTLFEAGSTLQLDVLGRDADNYPSFRHEPTVNRGRHSIYTGGIHDSHLSIPIVRDRAPNS